MSRRDRPSEMLMAPPHGGGAALRLPGRTEPSSQYAFPRIDEHVVRPETREEMVRGERIQAQPALAPHGDRHFRLDYVLGGHVHSGYVGSTDLLTHVLHGADFASDTCIRKEGKHPATGERFLEEIAFEVVHLQSQQKVTERAQDWTRRGVRRVFGVFVKKGTVEEWFAGHDGGAWRLLDPASTITDPCLVRPLGVRALLDAAAADDEVARALDAKGNPVILALKAESEERGEAHRCVATILRILTRRIGPDGGHPGALDPAVAARLQAETHLATLEAWLDEALDVSDAEGARRLVEKIGRAVASENLGEAVPPRP